MANHNYIISEVQFYDDTRISKSKLSGHRQEKLPLTANKRKRADEGI